MHEEETKKIAEEQAKKIAEEQAKEIAEQGVICIVVGCVILAVVYFIWRHQTFASSRSGAWIWEDHDEEEDEDMFNRLVFEELDQAQAEKHADAKVKQLVRQMVRECYGKRQTVRG